MNKGVNLRGYAVQVYLDPEDDSWVAEVPDLPGAVAAADDPAEALGEIEDVIDAWIEAAIADGRSVPPPRPIEEEYSGRFVVRVPRSLHRRLVQEAERDGVSLNAYCVSALSQSVGTPQMRVIPHTETWMQFRALDYFVSTSDIAVLTTGDVVSEATVGYQSKTEGQMTVPPYLLAEFVQQRG